jgi:hypothetical protein
MQITSIVRRTRPISRTDSGIRDTNPWHDIAVPHKVSTLVAWVLVALSIFFVFRPQQPLNRLQPPHKMLSAAPCGAHPDTSAIPAEYSCEPP